MKSVGPDPSSYQMVFVIRFRTSERKTIRGAPVTDEHIQAWADDTETGIDVDLLKKRGRGRPGRSTEPAQVVALRLTAEELAELDALAARANKTRSELIRAALAAYAA